MLTVEFKAGTCSPMGRDPEIRSIKDRLARENYSGAKPTAAFFTVEKARIGGGSKGGAGKRTPASTLSQKVYDSVFDVVNARSATIYTMYVDLIKIDISHITKEKDYYLNRDAGPFMVFYKADGTISGLLQGRMINASSYCREMSKVLGNPAESRRQLVDVSYKLQELEKLVRKEYVLKGNLKTSQAKVSRTKSKGGRGTSTAANLVETLKKEVEVIADQIEATKKDVRVLTSNDVSPPATSEDPNYSPETGY